MPITVSPLLALTAVVVFAALLLTFRRQGVIANLAISVAGSLVAAVLVAVFVPGAADVPPDCAHSAVIPNSRDEAASAFGGSAVRWRQSNCLAWHLILGEPVPIEAPAGWRFDYTGAAGDIHACEAGYSNPAFGPTGLTVIEATLWYLPDAQHC